MEEAAEPGSGEGQQDVEEETMISFFDVETTVPSGSGRGGGSGCYALLEFGAIVVCPRRLIEVDSFSTLIRPSNLSAISPFSVRCNGISRDAAVTAPCFLQVADKVFSILHGKIWAGHNILRFDCARIREAFAEIGRPPPEPRGTIDTLPLLAHSFGRRAGDMKMATLANYFGLGPQKHRSLDDVRMNLEVLKYCAAVLFLESNLSNMHPAKSLVYGNTLGNNYSYQNEFPAGLNLNFCTQSEPVSNLKRPSTCDSNMRKEISDLGGSYSSNSNEDASHLTEQVEQLKIESSQTNLNAFIEESSSPSNSVEKVCTGIATMGSSTSFTGFLEPAEVLVDRISVSQPTCGRFANRIHILHQDVPLWLCGRGLIIHFGLSTKFIDHAGRPKLSILVNAPGCLCHVLAICDSLAHRLFMNSGRSYEWRPLIKKNAFLNSTTIRLHIPAGNNGDAAIYSTEIYQTEPSGNLNKLVFCKFDATELDALLAPGTTIDAFFLLDTYDYLQNAGIRLVAKHLVVRSL